MPNTVTVVKKDNRGGPRPNSGRRPKRGKTERKDLRAPVPVIIEAIKVGSGEFSDGILTMVDEYMYNRTRSVQDNPPPVGVTVLVWSNLAGRWLDAFTVECDGQLCFEQRKSDNVQDVEYWRPQPLPPGESYPLFGVPVKSDGDSVDSDDNE